MVEAQAGDQQTIPGYCVLERIGSGGMADVFLARALDTAELVAIKVLRTALGGTDAEQRFHREIVALRELRHPRIVRYVDHGLTGEGRPYLVMERLEGIDLQEALRRRRLTLAETFSLGIQLADCLAAAHDRGVVHRDVKPANVFLIDGQVADVRVLDFGVARLDEGQGVTLTSPGGLVGTPGYMSPEQAKGAERADPQSDLFSLGSLLFECVSGAPAFPGEHVMAILAKVLLSEPPRLDEVVPLDQPRGFAIGPFDHVGARGRHGDPARLVARHAVAFALARRRLPDAAMVEFGEEIGQRVRLVEARGDVAGLLLRLPGAEQMAGTVHLVHSLELFLDMHQLLQPIAAVLHFATVRW